MESVFKDVETDEDVDEKLLTEIQKVKKVSSEGAYTLRPEWENGMNQYAYRFSSLDSNVVF